MCSAICTSDLSRLSSTRCLQRLLEYTSTGKPLLPRYLCSPCLSDILSCYSAALTQLDTDRRAHPFHPAYAGLRHSMPICMRAKAFWQTLGSDGTLAMIVCLSAASDLTPLMQLHLHPILNDVVHIRQHFCAKQAAAAIISSIS